MKVPFHLPPPKSWEDFEEMLWDLFRAEWNDPHAQKHGRKGQRQYGVDLFGQPGKKEEWTGVQAKEKDQLAASSLTEKELDEEVRKAKTFEPPLAEFIIATTGPRDQKIQRKARLLTRTHQKSGLFRVHVYSWEEIEKLLQTHWRIRRQWYRDLFSDEDVAETVDRMYSEQRAFLQEQQAFRASITADGVGSQEVYQIVIDQAKTFLDQFMPYAALSQLEVLQKRVWDRADSITRWKILTNIAAAKLQLNEDKEAARLLLQAKQYNPTDEKTLSNLAFAELLLGHLSQAQSHIEELLQNNPASENAYALQVKLLSLQKESFASIFKHIPEEWRGSQIVAGSLGDAAARCGDTQASHYWYHLAYHTGERSVEIALAYATSLLAPLVEKRSLLHMGKVSKEQTAQLEQVLTIYNDIYADISGSENKVFKADFFFNRGMSYRFLSDYEHAARDFDFAAELEPGNDRSRYQSALLALLTEKRDVAILKLEQIQTSNMVPAAALLAALYQEQKELEKAKETLRIYLEQSHPIDLQELAQRTLVEVLLASEQYEDAEATSVTLLSTYPEHIQNSVIRAGVLRKQGKDQEAYEYLAGAQTLLDEHTPLLDILALADQYYAFHEYNQAIRYYETVVDISIDDDITRKLLSCYYYLGREREALRICLSLRDNYGPQKAITEITSSIYESIGHLDKAKATCQEHLQRYPKDLPVELRLASINLRARQFDEVDAFLQEPLQVFRAPLEEQIYLCQLLSVRGFDDEALKLAYEIRRAFPNEPKAHTYYFGILVARGDEDDPLLKKSIIEEDTAIRTRDQFGKEKWYVLETRSDPDGSKREFPLTHPVVKRFLGKGVGETVVLATMPQQREETILEITSKYLYAFQEISTTFSSSFPGEKGFQVFRIHTPQTSEKATREDFSVLFDMIDQKHQETTVFVQAYRSGFLTLGALAKQLGKNSIEIFEQLRNTVDIGIRSATGTPHEFHEAKELLQSEESEGHQFVVDITSLLTWYDLGIADEMVQIFGRIAIVQSTVDILLDILFDKKFTRKKGYMSFGKAGNMYSTEDIPMEYLQKHRAYVQAILFWIQKACDVIPCDSALNMTALERRRWYESYSYDAIDSAILAKQEKRLFVSEDMCLRHRVKHSFALKSIWTQPLLEYLVHTKHLSFEQYQQLLIKLVAANYVHTSISVSTVEEAARQSNWKVTPLFEKVVQVLGGAYSEEASAMGILETFLFRLYSQAFFLADPDPLCFAVLDAFVAKRNHRMNVVKQFLSHLQGNYAQFTSQQRDIVLAVQKWLQRQILF